MAKEKFRWTQLKRLVFVTGRPNIGKTSVLRQAVSILETDGYTIGGMISREVRDQGVRVGFEIVNLITQQKGWLAHIKQPRGPRIGKYRVNMNDLNVIGATSILEATSGADVIVIDEIGGMELRSAEFRKAADSAVNSSKPVIGALHSTIRDPLIDSIRSSSDAEILEVTVENRGSLHTVIVDRVAQFLARS
ncbi:MAG: NTPase [Candidatus Bathyarchaeota archaeon]|nr:MAG: NTPase [Candidatus Bathyarchaeota archaeon]